MDNDWLSLHLQSDHVATVSYNDQNVQADGLLWVLKSKGMLSHLWFVYHLSML